MNKNRTFIYNGIVFILLFSFVAISTTTAQSKIQLGPFFGNGIRMITGNDRNEFGMGYHVGFISRVSVNKYFSVLPSALIARKGYYRMKSLIGLDIENQRLTYLDLGLPLKYQYGLFTFQAGMQAGILLDGVYLFQTENDGRNNKYIKSDMNQLDLGLIAGVGIQGRNGVGLDLMINKGLSNIYDNAPPVYKDNDEAFYGPEFNGKNFLLTINVYILFGYPETEMSR